MLPEFPSNFVAPGDYGFWELLNKVIQEEPPGGSDPTTLGLFASVGIVKGQPFNPDERMKKILTDAANIGAVTARTIAFKVRSSDAYFYPNSTWRLPFFGGYKFESAPGVTNMDGYIFYYYFATGVTPAMEMKMVGKGSQYPWSVQDAERQPVRWRQVVPDAPAAQCPGEGFLVRHRVRQPDAVNGPDGSEVSERQQPEQGSEGQCGRLGGRVLRPEGAERDMENNWVQTIPGKGWFMILRLYGPLEPWFDKTWRPGEIELQP